MPTTNLGRVAIVPQGAYNPATTYKKLDLVTGDGGSYMYINPTPAAGVSLTDTSHWQQIAEKGDQAYLHVKYAAAQPDSNDDMTDTPSAWIGIYSGTSATAPVNYTDYDWYNIKGEPGDVSNHDHGNITNDGKVGTTAIKPLITGTGGVVQAGEFGTDAGTFAQGNDARLSDARTPVSHPHGNITSDGKVGTVADKTLMTGENGLVVAKTMAEAIAIWKFTNPNLLHNWDFRYLPVNQRNASGTISVTGYFYDRWVRATANIVINSGYLTLATNAELVQLIEGPALRGKTVTASVMLSNGTVISSSGVFADGSLTLTGFGTVVIQSVYLTYHSAIIFKADAARNVAAVKLELGTVSTLAYDPPMDYGVELAKCQRYLQPIKQGVYGLNGWYMNDFFIININLDVPMRIEPSLATPLTDMDVGHNGSLITGFTFGVGNIVGSTVEIMCSKTAYGLPAAGLVLQVDTNANLLSAEL